MPENEYRVDVSEPAENDLMDIVNYISADLEAPITAMKMMETIEEALSKLRTMPHGRPKVREERLAAMGYRIEIIKNYIAFFTINEKEKVVDVERILYGRRDWKRILSLGEAG
jgi:plasmid stabilization system protein ParE